MDVTQIVEAFRRECAVDHVGLWCIPWHFREVEKVADAGLRQSLSLEVVRHLLASDDIGVGQFANGAFSFWPLPPSYALQRVETEWQQLGHEPDMGDIAWFTTRS